MDREVIDSRVDRVVLLYGPSSLSVTTYLEDTRLERKVATIKIMSRQ